MDSKRCQENNKKKETWQKTIGSLHVMQYPIRQPYTERFFLILSDVKEEKKKSEQTTTVFTAHFAGTRM